MKSRLKKNHGIESEESHEPVTLLLKDKEQSERVYDSRLLDESHDSNNKEINKKTNEHCRINQFLNKWIIILSIVLVLILMVAFIL